VERTAVADHQTARLGVFDAAQHHSETGDKSFTAAACPAVTNCINRIVKENGIKESALSERTRNVNHKRELRNQN
jgi:hypothetical protein